MNIRFFCMHTRDYQRTPCVHGVCRLLNYKKPDSIHENRKKGAGK